MVCPAPIDLLGFFLGGKEQLKGWGNPLVTGGFPNLYFGPEPKSTCFFRNSMNFLV